MASAKEPQLVTVTGVVATTRLIPGREIRLSRDLLNQLAKQFTPGSPLFRQHGTQQIGRVVSADLRIAEDGETELVALAELEVPAGFDVETFAGKGFSLGILAYGDDWTGKAPLVIGLDSVAYGDDDLRRVRIALDGVLPAYVTHYLQFAQTPPPTIIIQVGSELLPLLRATDGSQRWHILADAVGGLAVKAGLRVLVIRFALPAGNHLDAEIPATEPDRSHALSEAFEEALKSAFTVQH